MAMFRLNRSAAVAVNSSSSGRFTSLSNVKIGARNNRWRMNNMRYLSGDDTTTNYFDILGVDVRESFAVAHYYKRYSCII